MKRKGFILILLMAIATAISALFTACAGPDKNNSDTGENDIFRVLSGPEYWYEIDRVSDSLAFDRYYVQMDVTKICTDTVSIYFIFTFDGYEYQSNKVTMDEDDGRVYKLRASIPYVAYMEENRHLGSVMIYYSIIDDTQAPDDNEPDTPEEEAKTYTLTYLAEAGGAIEGSVTQTVEEGKSGTSVTAVADDGYEFVGWSDGIITAERTDTNIGADITVTALFEKINTTQFAGGSGTEINPYKISTAQHLQNIELYPSANYILVNDITLPQAEEGQSNFAPLFNDETMFSGTLNGNGFVVYNLTIYNTDTFYTGLFSCIGEGGSVCDLTLENVNLHGTNYIGGIAGYALGAVTDCAVQGEITYIPQNSYKVFIGGIIGRGTGTITQCTSSIELCCERTDIGDDSQTYIGGIVGYLDCTEEIFACNRGNVAITAEMPYYSSAELCVGGLGGYIQAKDIDGCSAEVSIYVESAVNTYLGGLIGDAPGGYMACMTDCYTTGKITAYCSRIICTGGLAGFTSVDISCSHSTVDIDVQCFEGSFGGLAGEAQSNISKCYYSGRIKANNTDDRYHDIFNIGGLIGALSCDSIENCYSDGDIEVNQANYAGGICGTCSSLRNEQITVSNSYTTMNISVAGEVDKIGALFGRVTSILINNTHWLYYPESGVEYAVGYSENLGIPTNIGATKHTDISDFYALADKLNESLDEAVWENLPNQIPTFIKDNED